MNLPNKITISRIICAPVFFVLYFLPQWFSVTGTWLIIALWAVYLYAEISDVVDGYIARKYNLVTDMGKVLDPFSDVMSRVTFFVCFAFSGFIPLWMLLIILYRELGIQFVRMHMMSKGIAMAASFWGKLKAVFYFISALAGMVTFSGRMLGQEFFESTVWSTLLFVLFALAVVSSAFSFITYIKPIIKGQKSAR